MNRETELETRLRRLEDHLGMAFRTGGQTKPTLPVWVVPLTLLAASFSTYALGAPNHLYQYLLGTFIAAIAYHQGWWSMPVQTWEKILFFLNPYLLATILKLFIGSGVRYPLSWIHFPKFSNWSLEWQPSALAQWSLDLTVLQSFCLLAFLFGWVARLEFLASVLLLVLFAVSIPAWVTIEWPWVFPALLLAGASWYFQVYPRRIR